ncbi:condensin-2 complex subunit H2-like isoform X2 [Tachypleus tridentatus]|uniref:condensin-2 complex subunit H2-like isoform X2 n=1 Tax=Tachypleus tridentatus TaxID=6853 RepID=UPI003FD14441
MALCSQGSVGDVERRFAHLLNPIRDLKKNWEIDIAAYLEEYLAELEELTFSFNNGATALNFAEAALLIQGSACVYSKKVEYLYRLVFQMLELLSSSKKSSQHRSKGHQEKDNDTVSNQTKDVEFIALDDLREQTDLDLVEETLNSNKKRSGIKFLPRIPTSLIPLEESEKGNIILHNHKGEDFGNKHDFRVNICHLDPSGALLLHGICYTSDLHRQPVTVLLHTSRTSQWQERNVERGTDIYNELDLLQVPSSPLPSPPPSSETESLTPRRLRQRKLNENHALSTPQPIDPWKPLDAHERTPELQRPLKRGETNRVPKNIQQKIQANKKNRKRKRSKKKNAPILSVSHFCTEAYFPYSSKFPRYQNKIPQSSVFYDLYWDEVKRKKAQKTKRRLFVEEQEKENVDETEEEDVADDNSSYPESSLNHYHYRK